MIELTDEFKKKVLEALREARERYDGSDSGFAKKYGINKSVYSEIKKGKVEKKINPGKWLELGRNLGGVAQRAEMEHGAYRCVHHD